MEEDIKRLEELIKPVHSNWIGISNQKAIENLLTRYKQLEEENKRLNNHNIIGRIDAIKIEDLEPVLKPYYISKSKVKEKMKKYEWSLNGYDSSTADYKHSQCIGRYLALQEILEKE